jgi:hypothetical protein
VSNVVSLALCGGVGLMLFVVSVRAARCNVRRFRDARATPPLDGVAIDEAALVPVRAPRTWPEFDAVTDLRQAAAYAALADDHAVSCALAAEMMLVIASATFGVGVALIGQWRSTPTMFLALLAALVGGVLRLRASRVWETVFRRYREVYESLSAAPLPPRRRRGLLAMLRR